MNRYVRQTSGDPQTVMIPSNLYLTLVLFHIVETDFNFLIDLKHISGEEADEASFVDLHDERPQMCLFLLNKAETR